ncbi:Alpha-ketoglutarate-dependent dioxygenase AlkB [Oligella urethralis]|uniref:alpha-ketoglutarate-dependent dioxygenase AlkB n=1 Tax=Oligella urethralis TaxID=90245 RepID=UPI000DFE6E0B|nr:alpha-ketoglutarate-dependent dioxygenase AlkB [Oligella urethralis]SUA48981.1 Alpha-ketoglutarate-dependent dioxygenase AlkB [Oligella urethralis]
MQTAGGHRMSVEMTNCGEWGWLSDEQGYRYVQLDPLSAKPWPSMPALFLKLACDAAATVGYEGFAANACLINRYRPGSKMSLHQDKNERDFDQPIVSVSLGLPLCFFSEGMSAAIKWISMPYFMVMLVIWGGEDRLRYHGVMPLKEAEHPVLGAHRINLTF